MKLKKKKAFCTHPRMVSAINYKEPKKERRRFRYRRQKEILRKWCVFFFEQIHISYETLEKPWSGVEWDGTMYCVVMAHVWPVCLTYVLSFVLFSAFQQRRETLWTDQCSSFLFLVRTTVSCSILLPTCNITTCF